MEIEARAPYERLVNVGEVIKSSKGIGNLSLRIYCRADEAFMPEGE